METVFSTKLVHPRDKFDFWQKRRDIVDNDSRPANRLSFEAEIDTGCLGVSNWYTSTTLQCGCRTLFRYAGDVGHCLAALRAERDRRWIVQRWSQMDSFRPMPFAGGFERVGIRPLSSIAAPTRGRS